MSLFGGETFFEKFLQEEAGGDAGDHFDQGGPGFIGAAKKMREQGFYEVGGLEAIGKGTDAAAHVLLVDIVLVFEIAYRLPQFFDSLYPGHTIILRSSGSAYCQRGP
jgi:hypothetical protein